MQGPTDGETNRLGRDPNPPGVSAFDGPANPTAFVHVHPERRRGTAVPHATSSLHVHCSANGPADSVSCAKNENVFRLPPHRAVGLHRLSLHYRYRTAPPKSWVCGPCVPGLHGKGRVPATLIRKIIQEKSEISKGNRLPRVAVRLLTWRAAYTHSLVSEYEFR